MSVVTLLYIMMFKQYIHYDTLYKTSHTYVYIYMYTYIVWMNYNALKVTSLGRWLVREVIHNHYSRYGTSHMYFDDKLDVLLIQHDYFSARYVK